MASINWISCFALLLMALHARSFEWASLKLPEEHIPYFFTNNPDIRDVCDKDATCPYKVSTRLIYRGRMCASRLNGAGFVDIFTGQIHGENDYRIQQIIYQMDNKDLLDYSVQTRPNNCSL